MDELKRLFESPPSEYRGKPFWAWNGRLDAAELRRQIRVMHRMGLGGFFMHSRVGLATPYLAEEWFEMVRACVEEARELGMEAWLYDEDRWPSGAAGGIVTREERFRHRNLVMVPCGPGQLQAEQEPLAVFAARLDGTAAREVMRLEALPTAREAPEGSTVLAFFVRTDEPSSWYNGATYLDTMNHEAVRRFIEVTHEAYRKHVGEAFGKLVPGIFTDEPNFGNFMQRTELGGLSAWSVPWTPALPEAFARRYGYDILERLPEIFYQVDGEPVSRVRRDYLDCITFLFVDAFARQIGEWCGQNGLLFTGHVLSEQTLVSQCSVVGAAMRFYEHMQAPGIDVLTERSYEYGTAKQCSSVQRQAGRRWMLSELYGCTGWDFSFEGHKAVGDWQAALGVNLRCQHLSWYTMSGAAKRDYPASIHFQSPWWQHYRKVEDYFARLGAVLTRGEAVRPLLVVHPIESLWALARVGWQESEEAQRLDRQFEELRAWLLQAHLDFDYGDEELMARLGRVERGERPRLFVGQAGYEAVLVPPLVTMRSSTAALLREFAGAGGRVIFCGELPPYVDAMPADDETLAFAADCTRVPYERGAVSEAAAATRRVSIADAEGGEHPDVLYMLRQEGQSRYLFLCNTNRRAHTGKLTVEVRGEGQVQLWDAESGRRYAVKAEAAGEKLTFTTSMPPSGSRLFVISPAAEDLPPLVPLAAKRTEEVPEDAWSAYLDEPNVLVLDRPRYRLGGGQWQGPEEILRVDAALRRALGLPLRGGQMVQPWARKKRERGPSKPVELSYRFQVAELPSGPLMLALEEPWRFEVLVNGHPVPREAECGWWVDPAIRLLPLDPAGLVAGENEIVLRGEFDEEANLEAMFLLGEFGVELSGTEATLKRLAEPGFGDWTQMGLPFYAGSVAYRARIAPSPQEGERVFVEVPEFRGACVRVLVDGAEAGVIGWPPHEVEVTDLVAGKSAAELCVEVISHRRNAFGPLHHVEKWPRWTGPGEYEPPAEQWREDYNLVPCGCLRPPRLSYRSPQ